MEGDVAVILIPARDEAVVISRLTRNAICYDGGKGAGSLLPAKECGAIASAAGLMKFRSINAAQVNFLTLNA